MTTLAPLSQSQYAEVKPAADPSDAGIEWRHERLKDFIWRARCARLENDPEVIRVVNEMTAMTNELDELAMKQRAPDAPPRPWWCDGEYDETRAEEANDKGMDAFKEKRYEEAFEFYTEAIRLEPRRAGYHANRAACALKLERFRVAADDADHAIEREKTHVKALVRAGKAYLWLRDPNVASIRFDAALALDPRSVAAAKGKADATRAAGAEAAETAAAAASARKGARAELPPVHAWPSLNDAAETLLDAETLLANNPRLEGAKASVAEAAILCGRIARAIDMCKTMLEDSADRAYLRAEALWRGGDIDAAIEEIERRARKTKNANASSPGKLVSLGSRLTKLKELVDRGAAEAEDGQHDVAHRAFTAALDVSELRRVWGAASAFAPGAAGAGDAKTRAVDPYPNHLRADVLRRRAACVIDRGDALDGAHGDDALRDLNECVAIDPNDAAAYMLRATVQRDRGEYERHFNDYRSAQRADPDAPGIAKLVQKAAKMAIGGGGSGRDEVGTGGKVKTSEFYELLGVTQDASAKSIRRGYRKAAAQWHPDKWQQCDEKQKSVAEKTFRRVAVAYETLSNAHQRRLYDQDPKRFEERKL